MYEVEVDKDDKHRVKYAYISFKTMEAKIWNKDSLNTSDEIIIKKLPPKPILELGLKLKKKQSFS